MRENKGKNKSDLMLLQLKTFIYTFRIRRENVINIYYEKIYFQYKDISSIKKNRKQELNVSTQKNHKCLKR